MKAKDILLRFDDSGQVKCLWTDAIDLAAIGDLRVHRASRIEYNNRRARWEVTIDGQVRFDAPTRQICIDWEVETLNAALAAGRI